MSEPGDWNAPLGFVRDVLEGALTAAEDDRVYPDAELIRRALACLERHMEERRSAA